MKIAIVEDNIKIRNELEEFLRKYNYDIHCVREFNNVIEELLKVQPDIILLDINLPLYDGYYICREIRAKSSIPIIIVTSRDSEVDELMSMNLGADDFITKPYNTQILLAHIVSVLNRTYNKGQSGMLEYNGLRVEISRSVAVFADKRIDLSKNELGILYALMQNKDNITKRDDIMEALWQSDEFVDDNTLTVNINRLRKKLQEIGAADYIKTKRGQGYSL